MLGLKLITVPESQQIRKLCSVVLSTKETLRFHLYLMQSLSMNLHVNRRCNFPFRKRSLPFETVVAIFETVVAISIHASSDKNAGVQVMKIDQLHISGSRFHVRSRVTSGQLIQKMANEPQHDAVDGGTKSKYLKKSTGWNVSLQSVAISGS